jgi:hypothetical protein
MRSEAGREPQRRRRRQRCAGCRTMCSLSLSAVRAGLTILHGCRALSRSGHRLRTGRSACCAAASDRMSAQGLSPHARFHARDCPSAQTAGRISAVTGQRWNESWCALYPANPERSTRKRVLCEMQIKVFHKKKPENLCCICLCCCEQPQSGLLNPCRE